MPFKPGHKKIGGRQKGSGNRNGFRALIEDALGSSIPERLINLIQTHPDQEIDILKACLPYAYPKLNSMTVSADVEISEDVNKAKIQELALKLSEIKADLE